MSPGKLSLLTIVVTGLLVSTGPYFARQDRQREAVRLRSENEQLRLKISRQHQAQWDQQSRSGQQLATGPMPAGSPSTAHLISKPTVISPVIPLPMSPTYRNEGQATPGAALQTLAWACDQGDTAMMEKLQVFDAPALEKAMKFFPTLPPEIRARWATPEAMSAALYISDGINHPYPGAMILEQAKFESINPTRVRLHLPGANGDGYEFQQTSEGWKVAVTMSVVDAGIEKWLPPRPQP